MTPDELAEDAKIREHIARFVNHEIFLIIKDAFLSNTPTEARDETSATKSLGILLGNRFAFNKLESIAKQKLKTEKQRGSKGEQDPDLAEE